MINKSIRSNSSDSRGGENSSDVGFIRSLSRNAMMLAGVAGLLLISACKTETYDYTGGGYEITQDPIEEAPYFNIYRPADMEAVKAETGKPLPVIAWANGGCFRSDFTWEPLFKRWAAEGYIVMALTALGPRFELEQTNATQQGKLIDWALSAPQLAGLVDEDRIVAAGNSCGGVTALTLTSQDPRIDAVFVLSGSSAIGSTANNIMGKINVPVGYVIGGPGDIAGQPARNDYEALPDGVPAMVVNRKEGAHETVSTEVPILEEVADISFHWMDLALNGTPESYEELMTPDVCSDCTPGDWTLTSKHLETLLK